MTGWTWSHVSSEVTLPQVQALSAYWVHQPPLVLLVGRLCRYVGVDVSQPKRTVARTSQEAITEAMSAGLPIAHGRPDDPDLAFLDE
jgi:hypothetical protein